MSEAIRSLPKQGHTLSEYFELELAATERHFYLDGKIIAMAGGTPMHALIMSNISRALGNKLDGTRCRHVDSNLRVKLGRLARYGYTDGLVVCGAMQLDPADPNPMTLMNPTLIVEVLSESSERFDRGEKFALYRELDSFREYVLISQQRAWIETFFRQDDNTWRFASFTGLDVNVPLLSLGIELPAREVYADVVFPPEPKIPVHPCDVPPSEAAPRS